MLTQCVGMKGWGKGGKQKRERRRGRKEGEREREGRRRERGRKRRREGCSEKGWGENTLGRWKLVYSGYKNTGQWKLE